MGELVVNSQAIRSRFDLCVLPIKSAESITDIGNIRTGKVFRMIALALRLALRCMETQPDLVYFTLTPNGRAFYRDLLFVGIMKLFGVRRVYHLHGKGVTQAVTGPVMKGLYGWAFRCADVILLSPRLYEDISQIVQREQCHFLPNGIPDSSVAEERDERKTAGYGAPRILFFSNLLVNKGIFILLEALVEVRGKGIPFRASFAGAWESPAVAAEFERFVQKAGLQTVVEYLGPRYGEAKRLTFASADIFAFPTYNDAFGLVLLEAMSHGLPVVSTVEGAIPDIVQEGVTGFLVPRKDAKTLADRLTIFLKDPHLREQMGDAGRIRYLKHFTKEVFEANLIALFERCLA